MALNKQLLVDGLHNLSAHFPASQADAMNAMADLYVGYASGGQALDAVPVLANKPQMLAAFLKSGSGGTFLTDLPQNLTVFWLVPPVPFAGALNNGPVTSITGAPVFAAQLAKMADVAVATGSDPTETLAAAIDQFTKSILIALVSSAGAAVPTLLS